jgi:hypothetical protein
MDEIEVMLCEIDNEIAEMNRFQNGILLTQWMCDLISLQSKLCSIREMEMGRYALVCINEYFMTR